jgi:hypothetical protein
VERKEKKMNAINKPKILIYDDENIKYITGYVGYVDVSCEPECVNFIDGHSTYIRPLSSDFRCSISDYDELNNIELDETTMKRIAKYNKEQECKRLDKEIEEKKKRIQLLEGVLEDREKRVDMLKKYIANIFDIEIKEDEDDYDEWD